MLERVAALAGAALNGAAPRDDDAAEGGRWGFRFDDLGGVVIDESEGPYVDPLGYLVVISGGLGPRPYPYDPRVTTFGGWGVGAPTVDPLTGTLIGYPFPGGAFFAFFCVFHV